MVQFCYSETWLRANSNGDANRVEILFPATFPATFPLRDRLETCIGH